MPPKNFSFVQLFKRRNVSLPGNEESMVESPIQDPDVSSTVPIPEVNTSVCLECCLLVCTVHKEFSLHFLGRSYYGRYGTDDFFG